MKYRIYFEPMDIEADDIKHAELRIGYVMSCYGEEPSISKILPIDQDGFVIKQNVS